MFHLPICKKFILVFIIYVFISCGFINLCPIEVDITPGGYNSILPNADSSITISFNTEMNKTEAEKLITISSGTEIAEHDILWKSNDLIVTPKKGWTAGIRYLMTLSGFARSIDGRELQLEKYIYFYAVNNSMPPLVERYYPLDGESIIPDNFQLEIHFSKPMDRLSTESSLNIEGMGERTYEWSNDDKSLNVIPNRQLSAWVLYRWSISAQAKSKEGVPLAQRISASFITDLDRIMPEVIAVYPVIQSQGKWFATGGSLEDGLGPSLGIAVDFNKPMGESFLRSLRFEPLLSGKTEKLSDKSIVFIPNLSPEPETVYTLIVSGDTRDADGLKIGEDYRRSFIADIPFMKVLKITAGNGESLDETDLEKENILKVFARESDGGLVFFSIHFSFMLDNESKQKAVLAISLSPFFPGNLDPIALRFVSWVSDDRLIMEWERLKAGSFNEPHYYRLLIPGGRGGISNGDGLYLKDDVCIYLEVENETEI